MGRPRLHFEGLGEGLGGPKIIEKSIWDGSEALPGHAWDGVGLSVSIWERFWLALGHPGSSRGLFWRYLEGILGAQADDFARFSSSGIASMIVYVGKQVAELTLMIRATRSRSIDR